MRTEHQSERASSNGPVRRLLECGRIASLTVVSLALAVAAPLAAQWDAVQSPIGPSGLAIVETRQGYRLEDESGPRRLIPVAEGTTLTAIRELTDGWVAAGEVFSARGDTANVSELALFRDVGGEIEAIPGPEGATGRFRMDPEPLVENGALVGLAWLEGDDRERNTVKAARWTGARWDLVETVAPADPEAQLALSATVLEDGSWLLVWAAFQAGDDDIFWSRRSGSVWSPPRRLHSDNDVPDIVPAVGAGERSALAAWSSYDGSDYRLRIARFDGESWHETDFQGEEGSLYPTFLAVDRSARIVYKSVLPRAWVVRDLAVDGTSVRVAIAPRERGGRPMVFDNLKGGTGEPGLRLRWVDPGVGGSEAGRRMPGSERNSPSGGVVDLEIGWGRQP